MAARAPGTTFLLLLLAAITQVLTNEEESHYKTMEAVVGQSVTLPCTLKDRTVKIVNVDWNKKDGGKLAVYNPTFGQHLITSEYSLMIKTGDEDEGFPLYFPLVRRNYSGIYICDIATFPLGSLRRVTELKVKDADKITCDVDGTVEVHNGENVTIRCQFLPDAHYTWTKDKMLVSEKESLELWQVTGVHAGVYTLTVDTGNKNLQKEFNIVVLRVTTSQTDLATASPQSNVTREGLIDSTDSSFTTSTPTGLLATDTSVTWTVSTSTDVTDDFSHPNNVTVPAGDDISSLKTDTHISVTSSSLSTHPDPTNSTTLSYDRPASSPTHETSSNEMRNESTTRSVNPEDLSTVGNLTGTLTLKTKESKNGMKVEDNARSHLLVLIIIPVLVLIAVVGFLYRRHIINQRMDLPPPFKPPPPPVKYVAVGQSEKYFPVSRCDSVPYV